MADHCFEFRALSKSHMEQVMKFNCTNKLAILACFAHQLLISIIRTNNKVRVLLICVDQEHKHPYVGIAHYKVSYISIMITHRCFQILSHNNRGQIKGNLMMKKHFTRPLHILSSERRLQPSSLLSWILSVLPAPRCVVSVCNVMVVQMVNPTTFFFLNLPEGFRRLFCSL